MNLKILNKKKVKEILTIINDQWGASIDLNYAVLQGKDEKLFLINRAVGEVDLERLHINKIGLYFGQLLHNELRLSIEGSQLVGPHAKKNVLEITKEQSRAWLKGEDLAAEENLSGFVLIKHNDFFGTGKIKEGKVLNFIPKGRRLKIS